jgi:hypothetical protein
MFIEYSCSKAKARTVWKHNLNRVVRVIVADEREEILHKTCCHITWDEKGFSLSAQTFVQPEGTQRDRCSLVVGPSGQRRTRRSSMVSNHKNAPSRDDEEAAERFDLYTCLSLRTLTSLIAINAC